MAQSLGRVHFLHHLVLRSGTGDLFLRLGRLAFRKERQVATGGLGFDANLIIEHVELAAARKNSGNAILSDAGLSLHHKAT